MERIKGILAVSLFSLLFSGCSYYKLIEGQRVPIAGYTVEPQTTWAARSSGKSETWTIDGVPLQRIRFIKGLADGQTMIEDIPTQMDKEKMPKFKRGMTPFEIMELVVDSVNAGGSKAEGRDLRPVTFGSAQGFRFDFDYVLPNGLEEQGLAVGAVLKDELHLILYSGVRGYYYSKEKEHVGRMIQSIRMQ